MKPFTLIAVALFTLVAILHAARVVFGWSMVINGLSIPIWASVLGVIVPVGLAIMVWKESRG